MHASATAAVSDFNMNMNMNNLDGNALQKNLSAPAGVGVNNDLMGRLLSESSTAKNSFLAAQAALKGIAQAGAGLGLAGGAEKRARSKDSGVSHLLKKKNRSKC